MADTEPARRVTFRDVLAIREFRALYVAQSLSVIGDQLARVALAWIVFGRSHSPLLTGLTFAVSYLPWIVGGPLLSVLADRLPRRTLMVACDLARLVLVLSLTIPAAPTVALIGLSGVIALLEPPFSAARAALIPEVVGEGDAYNAASTLGNTTLQLAVVLGFAVGGGLIAAVGSRPTLLLDAATFAGSALTVRRYVADRPAAHSSTSHWLADLQDGARFVFAQRELRWLVATSWVVVGTVITTEALAIPYAHSNGGGAGTAGLLTASLPFGVVVGALILGRYTRSHVAERLMLPLALLTPLTLSSTAANPSPAITAGIWFISGALSAMTVIANRVFVVAVPREIRGRAFGIAAAGISGFQGIGTLFSGVIAEHVGAAHAIADIALPGFALIVLLSLGSSTSSSARVVPTNRVSPVQDEEVNVVRVERHPDRQVWLLSVLLIVTAAGLTTVLHRRDAYEPIGLSIVWVTLLFVLCFTYPLRFQSRQQTWNIFLETVPMVLGLLFLPALTLVGARTLAIAVTLAFIRRRGLLRTVFNAASTACSTFAAIAAFEALVPTAGGAHPGVWVAALAGVLASEASGAVLVALVIWVNDRSWHFVQSLRTTTMSAGVAVVTAFLALAMAASLTYDVASAWAITVFVVLFIVGVQTYHRIAERANALDRLYVVARELSPTATEPSDLMPALLQLRRIVRADSLELAVPADSGDITTVVTVRDTLDSGEVTEIETVLIEEASGAVPATRLRESIWHLLQPIRGSRQSADMMTTPLRSNSHAFGTLTARERPGDTQAFERADLRLLEAAADQLAAALEKGRLVESLRRAATLDTLTGLANLDSLRAFLDTTLEGDAGGVLILINLDRFHEVNDMLGHDAGDAVLAEVARRLESSPAAGALVARVGGDQFAIAIPGAAGSEVARLAAMAVKSRVDGSIRLTNVAADVRVTIGISRAPDHGSDAATLLRRAEMAMTAAKDGSSGIGEWSPDYERDGSRRLQLLTGLRAALSDGSLRVEYQPKMKLGVGEVSGFEALVRWSHPELGSVSPAEFVPIAEATGLISALTSNVLRQALTACRRWHDAGKPVGIAVNVSARSLDDSVLLGQVAAMLTASSLEPRWLTLEITESSVMEDQAHSLAILNELRMLGVRLSIDDFGTGYSSLHQLRGLPVHEVKIDKSFVDSVDTEEADRAVVRAVVELCESLNLVTVAEGVERASQAYALESLGVQQVQGFFHGRPMTDVVVGDWLSTRKVGELASQI